MTFTSAPPCRAAANWSAASERSTASGSTMTVAPVPVAPGGRQLERVGLARHGLVAVALDPGRERQQLEQDRKLVRGTVDEAEIPLELLLFEILEPDHRLREPLHRCERCTEVVTGERDEPCEIGVQSAASVTA